MARKNKSKLYLLVLVVCLLFVAAGCSKLDSNGDDTRASNSEAVETTPTPTPTPEPTSTPTPSPTPTPRLVKRVKYESVANDWVISETEEYDENGNKIHVFSDSSEYFYEYDDNNLILRETCKSLKPDFEFEYEDVYTYEDDLLVNENAASHSSYNENKWDYTYEYDESGIKTAATKIISTHYLGDGKTDTVETYKILYEHNDSGDITRETTYLCENDELGEVYSVRTFEYGRSGNLIREINTIDGLGIYTNIYEYDDEGRLIKESYDFEATTIYVSSEYYDYEYEYFYE